MLSLYIAKVVEMNAFSSSVGGLCPLMSFAVDKLRGLSNTVERGRVLKKAVEDGRSEAKSCTLRSEYVEACRMVSKMLIFWQILLHFVTICNNIKFRVETRGKRSNYGKEC